jgi:hypothetical protein
VGLLPSLDTLNDIMEESLQLLKSTQRSKTPWSQPRS